MNKSQILDEFYIKTRAQLLDIAAFLDRLDRADGQEDHRSISFRASIPLLSDANTDKTRRILELLSDPTDTPIDAAHEKGASGAWPEFSTNS